MSEPPLWYAMAALFVVTGLLHLMRAIRRPDSRQPVRMALGVSAFIWAGAALLFRFVSQFLGMAAGGAAVAVMIAGAWLAARNRAAQAPPTATRGPGGGRRRKVRKGK